MQCRIFSSANHLLKHTHTVRTYRPSRSVFRSSLDQTSCCSCGQTNKQTNRHTDSFQYTPTQQPSMSCASQCFRQRYFLGNHLFLFILFKGKIPFLAASFCYSCTVDRWSQIWINPSWQNRDYVKVNNLTVLSNLKSWLISCQKNIGNELLSYSKHWKVGLHLDVFMLIVFILFYVINCHCLVS